MIKFGKNQICKDIVFFEPITMGFPSTENLKKTDYNGTIIGKNAILRSGSIFYCDVEIGDNFSSGHNILIREHTKIGNQVSIGTQTIIEGHTTIGNNTNIQSMVFIPTNTKIGNHVFIGPNVVITNDKYPPGDKKNLIGAIISDYAAIGANSTILPGIKIGKNTLIGAGSVVTKDVPDGMLAVGNPAKIIKKR
ncbi:acetyltransferase-like isoleucine patch superfamily enzyme [Methanomicrobium sp. W14]|uniref:acyltransferase n=1 Tax=Methanomicrobium sp. W14 TaxID=2817839 RepID=UPI001AE6417C|nr:acyltransferase [Methanomicrobium sp. W14]MBP2134350.1 acetyltransferase-like isoleucine patch superfamily enzyme [Methanomicrobium sp. W14]